MRRSVRQTKAEREAPPGSRRDRLAVLLALVTVVLLGSAFFLSTDTQLLRLLMPGPLVSAHGAIENCNVCHTKSGSGKLGWIHGLVTSEPVADSNACLTCHKMPDTAFNAHGASAEALKRSTKQLAKIAAETPAPQWAHAQSIAFPTNDMVAGGLYCATCHQEHQGVNFKLSKISNEQCQSCHVVKFDSFDGHHPQFDNYPFKRRTRIVYDHGGHIGKHFPEVAKKGQAGHIPATCSTCHDSSKDKRIMAVAPFEQTCSGCHVDQITGKGRVSGPKGIAFLTLPGLDLQTLKKKNAPIGEWPAASEAELTPFMKVMISRNERGRALIKAVDSLNLQDLSDASDDQIEAVTNLAWEIKRLFYAMISGKASDVLGNLNIACGAKLSANLVADLTASIPRDVLISAHQQWLPNLGTEMANRQETRDQEETCWITTIGGWSTTITESRLDVDAEVASLAKPSPPVQPSQQTETKNAPSAVAKGSQIDPNGRLVKGGKDDADAAKVEATQTKGPAAKTAANAGPDGGTELVSAKKQLQPKAADQTDDLLNPTEDELPGAMKAGLKDIQPDAGAGNKQPQPKAADQTDDLLNPSEEELRGTPAPSKEAEKGSQPAEAAGKADAALARPDSAVPADAPSKADANAPPDAPLKAPVNAPTAAPVDLDAVAIEPRAKVAPEIRIESGVDPESWAEYGGWYRQDYAIFYRPTGHKDKFIYSWLFLTAPQAPKGDRSPAAAVFDFLASRDAPGSCTKCHSVDDIAGSGRFVNFSPPKIDTKQGRFTNFIHEPHFGVLANRGCLTCHSLERGRPYLQNFDHGDPKTFVSNFGAVKKDLCQTCHTGSIARQDCLLCHKYHVNGVTTPIMSTRIPSE